MTKNANSPIHVSSQVEDDLEAMIDAYDADTDDQLIEDISEPDQTSADPKSSTYVPPVSKAEQFLISRMAKTSSKPMTEADLEKKLDRYLDKNGNTTGYKPTAYNATMILQNDPKTHKMLSLDLFSGNILINKGFDPKVVGVMKIHCKPGGENFWDDHEAALKTWLVAPKTVGGWGTKLNADDMGNAVRNAAYQNASHPIYELITSKPWDGVKRLDKALTRWLRLEKRNAAYNEQVSRLMFLAAVVRLIEPGHKFDFLPVLIGLTQGTGKSTFIESISMGHSGELREAKQLTDAKVMNEMTLGKWFLELAEVAALHGAIAEAVKASLSSRSDRGRGAYSKYVEDRPRAFLLLGTSNNSQFMNDPTGNRRIWPVKVGVTIQDPINNSLIRDEIQQVYAEALWVYREERKAQPEGDLPLFLTGEAAEIALRLQGEVAFETPEKTISSWIEYWITTPANDRTSVEIGGRHYRTAFCAQQAFTEYHASLGRENAPDYDRKAQIMMGTAIQLAQGVSEGKKLNHNPYGRQRTFYVDPAWLSEQVLGDAELEGVIAEKPADVVAENASPVRTSLFKDEDQAPAPVEFIKPEPAPEPVKSNVVPLSKTREDIIREDCTF